MKKVYIAGRITGLPLEKTREKFQEIETKFSGLGYEVINPMKIAPYSEGEPWEYYMKICIRELCICDYIYLIDDWSISRGARLEREIAFNLNIKHIKL